MPGLLNPLDRTDAPKVQKYCGSGPHWSTEHTRTRKRPPRYYIPTKNKRRVLHSSIPPCSHSTITSDRRFLCVSRNLLLHLQGRRPCRCRRQYDASYSCFCSMARTAATNCVHKKRSCCSICWGFSMSRKPRSIRHFASTTKPVVFKCWTSEPNAYLGTGKIVVFREWHCQSSPQYCVRDQYYAFLHIRLCCACTVCRDTPRRKELTLLCGVLVGHCANRSVVEEQCFLRQPFGKTFCRKNQPLPIMPYVSNMSCRTMCSFQGRSSTSRARNTIHTWINWDGFEGSINCRTM